MEGDTWLTFAAASRQLGKARGYLSNLYRRKPEIFENVTVKKYGNSYIIKEREVSVVLSRLRPYGKKGADHLKSRLSEWSFEQTKPILLVNAQYPLYKKRSKLVYY